MRIEWEITDYVLHHQDTLKSDVQLKILSAGKTLTQSQYQRIMVKEIRDSVAKGLNLPYDEVAEVVDADWLHNLKVFDEHTK